MKTRRGLVLVFASAWLLTASSVSLAAKPHANNNAQQQAARQQAAHQRQAQQQAQRAQQQAQRQRQAQERQHQVASQHREQEQHQAQARREEQQHQVASQRREQEQHQAQARREEQQHQMASEHRQAEQRQNEHSRRNQFQANHPARAEVLGRDANLNRVIGEDKGDLNGHYGQLKQEDASIRRQEQADAARNGGRLTGQEYKQLNHEETNLGRQISRDNYGAGNGQFQASHPARAEVLGRDANLNRVIGEDKGDLNGHYGQLKQEDASIRRQEQADAARNGGRLTGQEYQQLNHEENNLGRQISRDNYGAGNGQFQANHPARAEVLGRDANLNKVIGEDKGDLSGHYGQLKQEDASIRRQEQADAARNGGRLTGQEYKQLNHEETNLGRQISRDNYGAGNSQFQANHPARAEVLGRDANLNRQINQDEGHLNGQYGNLRSEDRDIQSQEQREAMRNGGYLTPQQTRQLNNEETALQRQIRQDHN